MQISIHFLEYSKIGKTRCRRSNRFRKCDDRRNHFEAAETTGRSKVHHQQQTAVAKFSRSKGDAVRTCRLVDRMGVAESSGRFSQITDSAIWSHCWQRIRCGRLRRRNGHPNGFHCCESDGVRNEGNSLEERSSTFRVVENEEIIVRFCYFTYNVV